MSKIIGIDPGTTQGAFIVLDVESKTILKHGIIPNWDLLEMLRNWPQETDPVSVTCETIQAYGQVVGAETFETCFWIGRATEICYLKDIPFTPAKRKDIIMTHCATNKAKDSDVRRAMIEYIGEPGTKKKPGPTWGISSHEWSALAVATFIPVQKENDRKIQELREARAMNKPAMEAVAT